MPDRDASIELAALTYITRRDISRVLSIDANGHAHLAAPMTFERAVEVVTATFDAGQEPAVHWRKPKNEGR